MAFFNPLCDDPASIGDCYGSLVWEAYQQGAGNPTVAEWTTVSIDENNGLFWSTGLFGEPNGFGGCPAGGCKTLSQWLATLSTDFLDSNLVLVSIGVGSYNQGQIGYFDDVTIAGTAVADATYDFEPAAAFETLGECVSTLIADECSGLKGGARAMCNHEQQMICFDLFGIK